MSWEIANNIGVGIACAIFVFGVWCWFMAMFGPEKPRR